MRVRRSKKGSAKIRKGSKRRNVVSAVKGKKGRDSEGRKDQKIWRKI